MTYPHDIHCPTDSNAPEPVGFCDRCNAKYRLADLIWQFEWAANTLFNTHWLVCEHCLDIPQEQRRVVVLGPDPVPLQDIRPGYTVIQENASGVPPLPPFVEDAEQA